MSCFILLYTFVGAALHKIPETLWSSALNLSYDVITEKQTAQYNVLILSVYVVRFYKERWVLTVFSQLWGLFSPHSNIQLCGRMFSFSSKGDVQRRKRKGKNRAKKRVKEYEQGGESDTFTPSCQFACGPPSLWVLGCFFCPPLSPCLVLSLKSKPGYVVSEEMKAGEGRDERLGKTWGWKCGDGQRIDGSAKILCHPSKSRWSQWVIKIQNKLW